MIDLLRRVLLRPAHMLTAPLRSHHPSLSPLRNQLALELGKCRGRGKAQADTLRRTRTETVAKRLVLPDNRAVYEGVAAEDLSAGDVVVVEAGEIISSDGEVIEGVASVDEAAVTGESAPIIRESGGDCSAVTGGMQIIGSQASSMAPASCRQSVWRSVCDPRRSWARN